MRTKLWSFALVVAFASFASAFAFGASRPLDSVLDTVASTDDFGAVAISPDGTRVAWTQSGSLYVAPIQRGGNAQKIASSVEERGFAWSPDNRQLAYLSDAAKAGQLQLYVGDANGQNQRKLTSVTGDLDAPAWSPDGKSVAVLFIENAPRIAGPLQPMTLPNGVIEEHIYEQRLAVVNPQSGELRQVSPADMYVYEYDWSPDSHAFVTVAAHGNGDDNWWIAQLYTVDAQTGRTASIYKPKVQIAHPRWSPDGKSVAFIQGVISDAGLNGGDVYVVDANGGEARDVTPGVKFSPGSLEWLSPTQILLVSDDSGSAAIDRLQIGGGIQRIWSAPESIKAEGWPFGVSLARDHMTSAVIRQSYTHPPEIWAGPIGRWQQLTHANDGLHPDWGGVQDIRWHNDGWNVQGWLMYPRDFAQGRRYPMAVLVHGGPASAHRPEWPRGLSFAATLSADGYFVFLPNPRGSAGGGEGFEAANVKDFGYGDFRDIMSGVDEVLRTHPVDANRLAILGWSYGGYMTMWAVTQTHRFRAAFAGAGISNWLSYYGENDIDQWMIPYFGASVYDNPSIYARSAPITFIKNVRTPTLIIVGDRDGECPAPQSYEFWHALKTLGVENEFVVYPNEGHAIRNPQHERDISERMLQWFDGHLK